MLPPITATYPASLMLETELSSVPPNVPILVTVLLLRSMRYGCNCAEALGPRPRPATNAAATIRSLVLKRGTIFMMILFGFLFNQDGTAELSKAIVLA